MKQQATFAKMKVQEREIRRQYFIDAAIRLLKLKDPGQVTIRDIANDIKVSIRAVYTYFASKDDLYLEILRRDTRLFEELSESKNSAPEKSFLGECNKLMNHFTEKKEISSLLIYFIGKQGSIKHLGWIPHGNSSIYLISIVKWIFRPSKIFSQNNSFFLEGRIA